MYVEKEVIITGFSWFEISRNHMVNIQYIGTINYSYGILLKFWKELREFTWQKYSINTMLSDDEANVYVYYFSVQTIHYDLCSSCNIDNIHYSCLLLTRNTSPEWRRYRSRLDTITSIRHEYTIWNDRVVQTLYAISCKTNNLTDRPIFLC